MKKEFYNGLEYNFNCWCKFDFQINQILENNSDFSYVQTTDCIFNF